MTNYYLKPYVASNCAWEYRALHSWICAFLEDRISSVGLWKFWRFLVKFGRLYEKFDYFSVLKSCSPVLPHGKIPTLLPIDFPLAPGLFVQLWTRLKIWMNFYPSVLLDQRTTWNSESAIRGDVHLMLGSRNVTQKYPFNSMGRKSATSRCRIGCGR